MITELNKKIADSVAQLVPAPEGFFSSRHKGEAVVGWRRLGGREGTRRRIRRPKSRRSSGTGGVSSTGSPVGADPRGRGGWLVAGHTAHHPADQGMGDCHCRPDLRSVSLSVKFSIPFFLMVPVGHRDAEDYQNGVRGGRLLSGGKAGKMNPVITQKNNKVNFGDKWLKNAQMREMRENPVRNSPLPSQRELIHSERETLL